MKAIKEILHTADGIGDKPMAVTSDSELEMLVELIQDDWTIPGFTGLPALTEDGMQTVHGTVLLGLMKRYQVLLEAREQLCNNCGNMFDRMMEGDLT